MLLDKGADINAQDRYYSTALQAASARDHKQVVQMLLDKGADVHAQGGEYSNALYAASAGGHKQVVQILLDKGADVHAQGREYGNALYAASVRGYKQVVQMLLDKGADINAQGGEYGNILQAASAEGYEQVVRILLDKGTDVNVQGGSFDNAIQERPSDQNNKEIYSYQGILKSSIIEDRISVRFRTDFVSLLRLLNDILKALKSRDIRIIQLFLEKNFIPTATSDYAWLYKLDEAGYSKREIAELFLIDINDFP